MKRIVVGAVPDASTLWSTSSCRPGHSSLVTPQIASTDLRYLQASFHRLIQTNSNNRSHRQEETQITRHTHLLQNSRQFPATCSLQNSGGYKIKPPCSDIKSNSLLDWHYSNDYTKVLANQLIGTLDIIRP